MLMTGKEYLESLRDGRVVQLGAERVPDVTTHPAFRNAARSFAMIYDRKRAAENRDVMAFEEDGETYSTYFLMPRTRADLERRLETHRRIAKWSHGLLGRSPDQFAGFVTGMAMMPEVLERIRPGAGANITKYYRHIRAKDIFSIHTVIPPQGLRNPAQGGQGKKSPALRVVAEDDKGVVINGMKMLGTSAIFAHETWVGNLQPLGPGRDDEAITCPVPLNAQGVSLWPRKPFEKYALSEFDNPLSFRFDETDSVVLFENVRVPWERVMVHNDGEMSRALYFLTPGHVLGNHQANIRFLEKLRLMIGIAWKIVQSNNLAGVPAVRGELGRLAALEAGLAAMIDGQIQACESMAPGYVNPNRRYMYAALQWCTQHYAEICDAVRELMGGGPFQMPADSTHLADPALAEKFEAYWSVPGQSAKDRMKLIRLGWDLLGSEFAGRHAQYEKFYAGPRHIMHLYSYDTCPWDALSSTVDDVLAGYDFDRPG